MGKEFENRPELLTEAEAAAYCRVCKKTLWKLRHVGILHAVKPYGHKRIFYRAEELNRFLNGDLNNENRGNNL